MPNPAPVPNFGTIFTNLKFLETKSVTLGSAHVPDRTQVQVT